MSDSTYNVTLSNSKQNTIEFDIEADGVPVKNATVNLVIESDSMGLMFEAEKKGSKKWQVQIPPIPMLKETTYPFKITLATEGYYFEPMSGSVNVVSGGSVKVESTPKIKTSEPTGSVIKESGSLNPKKKEKTPSKNNMVLNESIDEDLNDKEKELQEILSQFNTNPRRRKRIKSILNY